MHTLARTLRQQYLGALALALVVAGGATFAATGQSLVLGGNNEAGKTSILKNTGDGPALTIKNKPGQPPFKVNSRKVVNNLNASSIQGFGPGAFMKSDGAQVLYASASPLTTSGQILSNSVYVPKAGTVVMLITGTCGGPSTTIHALILGVDGDTRSASNAGGGACSFAHSWPIAAPDLIDITAEWNPSVSSFLYGTVLVFFQPS